MKYINFPVVSGAISLLLLLNVAEAQPSRLFSQETARVALPGTLSVDFEYDTGSSEADVDALRIGIFGGEMMINTSERLNSSAKNASSAHIGYKGLLSNRKDIALYGLFGFSDVEDGNGNTLKDSMNLVFGGAYTYVEKDLALNVNAEFFSHDNDVGPDNDGFRIGLGGIVAFHIKDLHASAFFAELDLIDDDVDTDPVVTIGFRLVPYKKVSLDFAIIHDEGDFGDSTGVPGIIKLNLEI